MSEPTGNPVSEASDSEWCRPRCGPDPERLNAAGTKPNDVARWVPITQRSRVHWSESGFPHS